MTLAASFLELEQSAARLDQVFRDLVWAAVQGQPAPGAGPAIVDHWETASQDTADLARGTWVAAREGRLAVNGRFDPTLVRQALVGCQGRFNDLWLRYVVDLAAFERRLALAGVPRRSSAWSPWAEGVVDALDQCPQALYDLSRMLGRCWEELVDRLAGFTVSAPTAPSDVTTYRPDGPAEKVPERC